MTPDTGIAVETIDDLREALESLPLARALSDADTDVVYGMAYRQLEQGHYEEARGTFWLLTMFKPARLKYAHGLAQSLRMIGRHEEAAGLFAYLWQMDGARNLQFLMDKAECEVLGRDVAQALDTLERIVEAAADLPGNGKIHDRALALRALLHPKGGDPA